MEGTKPLFTGKFSACYGRVTDKVWTNYGQGSFMPFCVLLLREKGKNEFPGKLFIAGCLAGISKNDLGPHAVALGLFSLTEQVTVRLLFLSYQSEIGAELY